MKKYRYMAWFFLICILLALFLLSSTDLFIKERERVIWPISVILDTTDDAYYINLKKGMDAAALELGVDINFISVEQASAKEQIEIWEEEAADGTSGIILYPIAHEEIETYIGEKETTLPAMSLGEAFIEENIGRVGIDYGEVVEQLLDEIEKDIVDISTQTYYIFLEDTKVSWTEGIEERIRKSLEERGADVHVYKQTGEDDTYHQAIENLEQTPVVFLSLDKYSTTQVVQILSSSQEDTIDIQRLYGIGSTTYLLNRLEQGVIDGLLVWNEYYQGYLAVSELIDHLQNHDTLGTIDMDTFFIRREDVRKESYMKILYPIE